LRQKGDYYIKITVFSGSHKGKKGNTLSMVEEFLNGAEEAGADAENIILAEKNIRYAKENSNAGSRRRENVLSTMIWTTYFPVS